MVLDCTVAMDSHAEKMSSWQLFKNVGKSLNLCVPVRPYSVNTPKSVADDCVFYNYVTLTALDLYYLVDSCCFEMKESWR